MKIKLSFGVVCFVFFLFLFSGQNAMACSCEYERTLHDSVLNSQLVIVGRLETVNKVEDPKTEPYFYKNIKSVVITVEKVFKGDVKVGEKLTFAQGNGGANCLWSYDESSIGDTYLLFLPPPSKGHPVENFGSAYNLDIMYSSYICDRSKGIDRAGQDLLYLNKLDKVQGKTRLSGVLSGYEKAGRDSGGIKIKIIGEQETFETITNAEGFYEIYDLPAQTYFLEPELPKGWTLSNFISGGLVRRENTYPQETFEYLRSKFPNRMPFALNLSLHAEIDLIIVPDTSIQGKIISPDGRPLKGICVKAVQIGKDETHWEPYSCTNNDGIYNIKTLPPEKYVLIANYTGKISEEKPFGKIFYPGVTEEKDANPITVELGKHLIKKDIAIPAFAEMVEIKGKLLHSDGEAAEKKNLTFLPNDSVKFLSNYLSVETGGIFSFKIPIGASGKIVHRLYLRRNEYKNCPQFDKLFEPEDKDYKTLELEHVISGDRSQTDIEIRLPFPKCEKATP